MSTSRRTHCWRSSTKCSIRVALSRVDAKDCLLTHMDSFYYPALAYPSLCSSALQARQPCAMTLEPIPVTATICLFHTDRQSATACSDKGLTAYMCSGPYVCPRVLQSQELAQDTIGQAAHLNSSSEGRLSDQAMGVCTAVMSSCPKSMMTSLHSSLPCPGFFRMPCHRLQTCSTRSGVHCWCPVLEIFSMKIVLLSVPHAEHLQQH